IGGANLRLSAGLYRLHEAGIVRAGRETRSGDRQVLGNVATITAVIAAFLLLISVVQPAAERLHLPYTVLLAVVGVAVGGLPSFLLYTPLNSVFDNLVSATAELPIGASATLA